jgi:hypothetical protein
VEVNFPIEKLQLASGMGATPADRLGACQRRVPFRGREYTRNESLVSWGQNEARTQQMAARDGAPSLDVDGLADTFSEQDHPNFDPAIRGRGVGAEHLFADLVQQCRRKMRRHVTVKLSLAPNALCLHVHLVRLSAFR